MYQFFKATSRFLHRLLIIPLLITSWFACTNAMAQKSEVGFYFGGSYYIGDLNPTLHFAMTRIGAGALYRFNINENFAIRLNGFMGNVAGSDSKTGYNTNRNLHFRSNIYEASIQGEVNFVHFIPGNLETPATPYLFGGGGVFRFNPQAEINGQWYDLRQLNTEGQGSDLYPDRKPYALVAANLLFGIGYKFNITRQFTGAFEWGMRLTSTDYLDDVSTTYPDPSVFNGNPLALELYDRTLTNQGQNTDFQRGNSNYNDWYSFAGIILTFRIKDFSRQRCPAYN
jgi:hypothetical protein